MIVMIVTTTTTTPTMMDADQVRTQTDVLLIVGDDGDKMLKDAYAESERQLSKQVLGPNPAACRSRRCLTISLAAASPSHSPLLNI